MPSLTLKPFSPGAPSEEQLQAIANRGLYIFETSGQSINSTSWTAVTGTGASVSITKHLPGVTSTPAAADAGSSFMIEGDIEVYVSGSASTTVEFGVRFTQGGTVIERLIGRKHFNETGLTDFISGVRSVTETTFPAGVWTMVPILRRQDGSGVIEFPASSSVALYYQERIR